MAANIATALERVDPAHGPEFRANLARFEARVDEALFGPDLVREVGGKQLARQARAGRLDDYLVRTGLQARLGGWLRKAAPLRERPVVTYHKTSAYLADRFGFVVPVEIEEKPGIPPSARHRDAVLELMRQRGVRTIFQEIYYERTAADYLAGKTSAKVVADPIDVGTEVGVPDYFALIERLLDDLVASEGAR
jgi:ABC-type Zn uptake system ZnuABC Zn-binding protein ZnuA